MKYLLDTQAFIWMLAGDKRFPRNLREKVEYYEDSFSLCDISLLEIAQLQALGRDVMIGHTADEIDRMMVDRAIGCLGIQSEILETMKNLPVLHSKKKGYHTDPFDRYIIAAAIRAKRTLISSDENFPQYRKYGLTLIEL